MDQADAVTWNELFLQGICKLMDDAENLLHAGHGYRSVGTFARNAIVTCGPEGGGES